MKNKRMEHAVWRRLNSDYVHGSQSQIQMTMDAVEAEFMPILQEIIAKCRLRSNSASTLAAHALAFDIIQLLAPWDDVQAGEVDELAFRGGDENV